MVLSSHAWLIEKLNTSIDCQRGGGNIWLLFPTLGCLKKIKELRNFWKRHIRCSFAIFERTWITYHTVNICCVVIVIIWYTAGTSGSPFDRINRRAKKYKFKLSRLQLRTPSITQKFDPSSLSYVSIFLFDFQCGAIADKKVNFMETWKGGQV